MPNTLSKYGLMFFSLSVFALAISFASVGNCDDNLDRQLGLTAPTPRPNNNNTPSLRPAPTPTQAETRQASRGDLKNLQSSANNQFNPNPPHLP